MILIQKKNLKKIIWKSYDAKEFNKKLNNKKSIEWKKFNDIESDEKLKQTILEPNLDKLYFQKENSKEDFYRSEELNSDLYIFDKDDYQKTIQLETFIPSNNFLYPQNLNTTLHYKSSFNSGAGGGVGHQNISARLDYGLNENSLLSFYASESDDPLYNLIDNEVIPNTWSIFAFAYKKALLNSRVNKNFLSFATSIEYWIISSGSGHNNRLTKSIFNEVDNTLGKDSFRRIVSSISLPYTRIINDKANFTIAPGAIFIPSKLGNKSIGDNFYGNNFYISSALEYLLHNNFKISTAYGYLLGPGYNYFDKDLNYSRKLIYSYGFAWDISPVIGIEGKITNGYGATPATGLLTLPSDNEALFYLGTSYKPNFKDKKVKSLKANNEMFLLGGLSVENAFIPSRGESQFDFDIDSKGSLFSSYRYSLSNIFQFQVINLGSYKGIDKLKDKNSQLKDIYLSKNNFNYRLGGKVLLFAPENSDLFWLSSKLSFGRNLESRQGYFYSDITGTFKLLDWLVFNINPKYFSSGMESFGVIGFSSNINLAKKIQLLSETNIGLNEYSENNVTFSLRYSYLPKKSIDLYLTNAAGFVDIGQFFQSENYKVGVKLNFIF